MIKVYVWKPEGNYVGHASMSVRQDYISWWPTDDLGKTGAEQLFHCDDGTNHSFLQDVREEGHHPTDWVVISNLDENEVINWWVQFRLGGIVAPQWCTLGPNCSTVVASALIAAGALERLELSRRHLYQRMIVWKPMEVLRFARDVAARS